MNILGVRTRVTNYIAAKPSGHSIPPKIEQLIVDVIKMDKMYDYNYIFFATEDEKIKQVFFTKFGNKLKLLNPDFFT